MGYLLGSKMLMLLYKSWIADINTEGEIKPD